MEEACARCGGDVSYGATYAPDCSLLCAECATMLKAAARAMAADQARNAKALKAKKRKRAAMIGGGSLAVSIVFGILLLGAIAAFFSRLDGCVDRVLQTIRPGGNFF